MPEIAITLDFFDSFRQLPKNIQTKTKDFLDKIGKDPHSTGLNLEKINKAGNTQLYSARVDDKYRAIFYKDKLDKKYIITWVDNHPNAYDWAESKKYIDVNIIASVIDHDHELAIDAKPFTKISTNFLLALGVPQKYLALVRNVSDIDSLYKIKDILSPDAFANLEWLGIDTHVQLIIDENERTKEAVLDFIKREVLNPAIDYPMLDEDIKSSVRDTLSRLEKKKSVKEIGDFFEDALISKRGKEIHDTFQKLGLKAFEDIAGEIQRLCSSADVA
jgi:mRNA-degrading endonuclease RelE of RelBE toxin-antitoxin system